MNLVRRYFTFTPYPNPGDHGRTMTYPWRYLETFKPDVIIPEEAKNVPFHSRVEGDKRCIVYAESDDSITTMFNDGSVGLLIDYMILEAGSMFNFQPLSEGPDGTAVALANYFSPARTVTVPPDNGSMVYSDVVWNLKLNKLEQTVTTM